MHRDVQSTEHKCRSWVQRRCLARHLLVWTMMTPAREVGRTTSVGACFRIQGCSKINNSTRYNCTSIFHWRTSFWRREKCRRGQDAKTCLPEFGAKPETKVLPRSTDGRLPNQEFVKNVSDLSGICLKVSFCAGSTGDALVSTKVALAGPHRK